MQYSSKIISRMLPAIHTMKTFEFLKPIINFHIIYFSVELEPKEYVLFYETVDYIERKGSN